jgi:integrase
VAKVSATTGERLSHSTVYAILTALRTFFQWLAGQRGYKQAFAYGDWDYFTPTGATTNIAKAHRPSRAPTIDEIRRVIELMPNATEIEKRNRAILAFLTVTAGRVSALASFQLRHIDIQECLVLQDARVVKTKKRKTFSTWLFPVGEDLERIVLDWAAYLRNEKKWSARDPLFPRTRVIINSSGEYQADGLERAPWASAAPIRRIVCDAFTRAGLPYPNPHAFRQTIVAYGRENCLGFAAMQAWAQNLGHDSLTVTFGSYGKVSASEQGKLVRSVRPRAT